MLFHITQVHTPDNCRKGEGDLAAMYNPDAEGVKLRAVYGAFSEHVIYYIVEAENLNAIYKFLDPGWKLSTSTITPVGEEPIESKA